jgi:hypothetical protein
MSSVDKLKATIDSMNAFAKAETRAGRSMTSRCLETVRHGLGKQGLKLPQSRVDYKTSYAVDCGKALLANPGRWGWEQVHSPLTGLCLCFFKQCGRLKNGKDAGHVAIYDPATKTLYANKPYTWSQYWANRIIGAFVPG